MLKNITKAVSGVIIGVIVIIVTLVIYFFGNMTQQKELIDVLALLYIVLSELILFGSIYVLNTSKEARDKVFIKAGIISTLFLYWLATTIFYLVFKNYYINNIVDFQRLMS